MIMFDFAMELVMSGAVVYASSMYGDILLETVEDVECEIGEAETEEDYTFTHSFENGAHYFYAHHEDYDE